MNLPVFIKTVDRMASEMTKEQLEAFVHETARTLPEGKRQEFTDLLNEIKSGRAVSARSESLIVEKTQELSSDIERTITILIDINKGERCLDSEYNEEWDDWYNNDVDEVLFSDPEDIVSDIEYAAELVHRCIDLNEYNEGLKLAELLSALEISVMGDYLDYDGRLFGISDLFQYDLIVGDFKDLVRESVFISYMGNKMKDRAEEMYCMMGNYECYDIRLEDIMQTGKSDLPDFEEFLPLWINYLGDRTEWGVTDLLDEAMSMVTDDEQRLEAALGWSSTFMKEGIALFLLLLYEGKPMSGGINRMMQNIVSSSGFKAEEYFKGTGIKEDIGDYQLFSRLFCQWKKDVTVSDEEYDRWMKHIKKKIATRVKGIMDANRRNYYNESAAFIAAWGEVAESRGERGAKQRILEHYMSMYPRRRNFIADLKSFGLRK